MPTSSATNITPFTRHRNPLHAYLIMIHCLKVYELILCSENNESGDCMDQVSAIEANIRTCGRSEWQREGTKFTIAEREKRTMPAKPTTSCRRPTRMKPLDSTSSITIELWRPPASLPLAASSSRYTSTLFL